MLMLPLMLTFTPDFQRQRPALRDIFEQQGLDASVQGCTVTLIVLPVLSGCLPR